MMSREAIRGGPLRRAERASEWTSARVRRTARAPARKTGRERASESVREWSGERTYGPWFRRPRGEMSAAAARAARAVLAVLLAIGPISVVHAPAAAAAGHAAGGLGAAPSGKNPALPIDELILQLARDEGIAAAGAPRPGDATRIRALLEASARLGPNRSEPQLLLHELSALAGDNEAALAALRRTVEVDPAHQSAFVSWIDLSEASLQTIEQRTQLLERLLQENRPGWARAIVQARLAMARLGRMDRAGARAALEAALAADPACPEAVDLRVLMLDDRVPAAERLRALLAAVRLHPLDGDLVWSVGSLLDECGQPAEALRFYDAARVAYGGGVAASHQAVQLAENALARGDLKGAIEILRAVTEGDSYTARDLMVFLLLLKEANIAVEAEVVRQRLRKRFEAIREPDEFPVEELAQASWFYILGEPQAERALMLAEAAARRAPGDPFVTRVLGWAQAFNSRNEDARNTLAPLAERDAWAAYRLAKLHLEAGDEAAARRVLAELKRAPRYGPAAERLRELGLPVPATQASTDDPAVREALEAFDMGLFECRRYPERFVGVSLEMEDVSPAPGEPWMAVITLTNRSRSPILLGPDGMVNPVIQLSLRLEGERTRELPDLLTVHCDATRVLSPGQSVRVRLPLDVGPARRMSRLSPQRLMRVTVDGVLDPVRGSDGSWQPGPTGQRLRPVRFNRVPAGISAAQWAALFAALAGEEDMPRARAIEQLGQLLGEAQRGAQAAAPEPIPEKQIQQALRMALTAPSWEIRARTLEALQVCGLNAEMVQAVEQCLTHEHWLVRMMAVRLLARQEAAFVSRAEQIQQSDGDALVRMMAESYVLRARGSRAAASAPAQPPGGAP